MSTEQLAVSAELYRQLGAMAELRHCTVGELIAALIREPGSAPPPLPSFVGMFANEPELLDQVMEEAYRTRSVPLRST